MSKIALMTRGEAIFGFGKDERSAYKQSKQWLDVDYTFKEFLKVYDDDFNLHSDLNGSFCFEWVPEAVVIYVNKYFGDRDSIKFLYKYRRQEEDQSDYEYYRWHEIKCILQGIMGKKKIDFHMEDIPDRYLLKDKDDKWIVIKLPTEVFQKISDCKDRDQLRKIWREC